MLQTNSSSKVSGRGGWKQRNYFYGVERELNKREKTLYEKYCEYCECTVGCPAGPEHIWYVVSQSIPSH